MNVYALLMMGGVATRFKADVPKQFSMVNDKPLFSYIVRKIARQDCISGIVIVTAESWLDYTKDWTERLGIQKIVDIVKGGDTRSESVRNGLEALENKADDLDPVLIYDASHPYVDEAGTKKVAEMVCKYGAATLASLNYDTTYLMDDDNNIVSVIPRRNVIAGASPEGFRFRQIYDIYENKPKEEMAKMTSAGAIAIANNIPVKVVPTSILNIKITYPEDLKIFNSLFDQYFCNED